MVRRVLLIRVVVHQLKRFRNSLVRVHVGIFAISTVTQESFVDPQNIRSTSIDSIYYWRSLAFQPRVVRGSSTTGITLFGVIGLVANARAAECQIFTSCHIQQMLNLHGGQKVLNLKDARGTRDCLDGQVHGVSSTVIGQHARGAVSQGALLTVRRNRQSLLLGRHFLKVSLSRRDPVGLIKVVGSPHVVRGTRTGVVDQIRSTGKFLVFFTKQDSLAHLFVTLTILLVQGLQVI
mmetsp:Transcript_23223/g.38467  ORF Transcript_23223/g.38467 Transcript_23223/m.38467 type:complete len:235 (-) Transcript_23223:543-1247(-)